MAEHIVAEADELGDGDRLVTELEGREVGVFNIDGEYYAYTSWCAHQSGPICEGTLGGTREAEFDPETLETDSSWGREGYVLRCPWHEWEYDVRTGECLSYSKIELPTHDVRIEDGNIIVTI